MPATPTNILIALTAAASLALAACSSKGSSGTSKTGTGGAAAGTAVQVTEKDFSISLARNTFAPGTYTFEATNAADTFSPASRGSVQILTSASRAEFARSVHILGIPESSAISMSRSQRIYSGFDGHIPGQLQEHETKPGRDAQYLVTSQPRQGRATDAG